MAVLLRASVLSDDEKAVVSRLAAKIRKDKPGLDLLDKYFGAKQRLQHIGIAVPAELLADRVALIFPCCWIGI